MQLLRAVTFNILAMIGLAVIMVMPLIYFEVESTGVIRLSMFVLSMGLVLWLGAEYCYDECGEDDE